MAMIPARIGSTRLKMKNLALIDGKPLISYSIIAAQKSAIFDRIIINSDSDVFQSIADSYGVEFYKRPEHLGSSTTKSDDVVLDFVKKYNPELIVWVNPISPLQTGVEIRKVVEYFQNENLDSLITVKDEQVHCVYKGKPVNFIEAGKFAQTQDLEPVQPFVYSIMMWRTGPFVKAMNQHGYAFFVGKVGYYPVSKLSTLIVKNEEDLKLASFVLRAKKEGHSNLEFYEPAVPLIK